MGLAHGEVKCFENANIVYVRICPRIDHIKLDEQIRTKKVSLRARIFYIVRVFLSLYFGKIFYYRTVHISRQTQIP